MCFVWAAMRTLLGFTSAHQFTGRLEGEGLNGRVRGRWLYSMRFVWVAMRTFLGHKFKPLHG